MDMIQVHQCLKCIICNNVARCGLHQCMNCLNDELLQHLNLFNVWIASMIELLQEHIICFNDWIVSMIELLQRELLQRENCHNICIAWVFECYNCWNVEHLVGDWYPQYVSMNVWPNGAYSFCVGTEIEIETQLQWVDPRKLVSLYSSSSYVEIIVWKGFFWRPLNLMSHGRTPVRHGSSQICKGLTGEHPWAPNLLKWFVNFWPTGERPWAKVMIRILRGCPTGVRPWAPNTI